MENASDVFHVPLVTLALPEFKTVDRASIRPPATPTDAVPFPPIVMVPLVAHVPPWMTARPVPPASVPSDAVALETRPPERYIAPCPSSPIFSMAVLDHSPPLTVAVPLPPL